MTKFKVLTTAGAFLGFLVFFFFEGVASAVAAESCGLIGVNPRLSSMWYRRSSAPRSSPVYHHTMVASKGERGREVWEDRGMISENQREVERVSQGNGGRRRREFLPHGGFCSHRKKNQRYRAEHTTH